VAEHRPLLATAPTVLPSTQAPSPSALLPEVDQTAHGNLLLTRALDAVQSGDLEAADDLLRADIGAPLTLGQVFRLYQTELEAQSLQLRESQLRTEQTLDWFANLFRTLPVAALLVDRLGMIVDANAMALDELELRDALRILPVPLRRLTATAEGELRLAALLPTVTAEHTAVLDDMALRSMKGRARWADLRITQVPAREVGNAGPLFLCVLNDRTAWVEAQRAREAAAMAEHQRDLAQSASQAKTQLLSRVSHELRTPLNAVIGFSQLLLVRSENLPDEGRRQVALIQEAGQHLLALVDEVLQINRAEAGQMLLDTQAVSLLDQARQVLALQQPMAEALGLQCTLELPDDGLPDAALPEVLASGDPRRVREVLTNLVSNAIKYNRHGGWLRLQQGHDARAVWLSVSDSGIGMTPQQLDHLFEPFNRLGADRLPVVGHGLGLSIARTLTHAMGGTLRVDSTPGEGSRFVLELPRWDVPVHPPA
jgi:signal transduction histidine kinase